ncbi:MAG: 50S ribosomal protein L25 [Chitinophagaceae bacterium]|nr:50S ribosomal protein L25 [Chitinophagaceae bacterium]
MKVVTIEGQLRSDFGKKAARRDRSEGKVPCVIYGGSTNVHFTTTAKDLKTIVYTPEFKKAHIKVEGKEYICILKDLQFDKITDEVIHLDFLQLVDGKMVNAKVPLNFTGQSVGVKAGGRFVVKMSTINIRTAPENLKAAIDVDITNLEIGKNLRVEDIIVENTEIMHHKRIPVAAVVITRALKQEANEAAKAEKGKK